MADKNSKKTTTKVVSKKDPKKATKPAPKNEKKEKAKAEKEARKKKKEQAEKDNSKRINKLRSKLQNDDQKLIFDATIKSEISGRADNAYKLERAKTSKSGYSFGWVQFDLPGNKNEQANNIIKAAINTIGDKEFNKVVEDNKLTVKDKDKKNRPLTKEDLINQLLKTKGKDLPAAEIFASKINKQLESGTTKVDGKNKKLSDMIDDLSLSHIADMEACAEKAVKGCKDPELRKFAKIFVADVNNQFGTKVNKALQGYMNGKEVKMPDVEDVILKPKGEYPDLMDLLVFHQNTKYATSEKHGADLLRRFNNIFATTMEDKALSNETARSFIKSCLKDGKMDENGAKFLMDKSGFAANFKGDKNTFMQNVISNKMLSNLIAMGAEKYIGNEKIQDLDIKTAALLLSINSNIGGLEKDKKLSGFLTACKTNPGMSDVLSYYLKYAKDSKDKNAKELCIQSIKEHGIEIKDEKKLSDLLASKVDDNKVDDFIKENMVTSGHCNAWNHDLTCCCGFGGPR